MKLKLVYSLKEDLDKFKTIVGDKFEYEVYDENYTRDYKRAHLLKYTAGTRMTPFIGIYNNNKLTKGFYQEDAPGCLDALSKFFGDIESGESKIISRLNSDNSRLFIDDIDLGCCVKDIQKIKKIIIKEINNG